MPASDTPIVSLADLKDHMAFSDDLGSADDRLLEQLSAAAQAHIERLLGFKISERAAEDLNFDQSTLVEAICQLAAWWYEQREGAVVGSGVKEIPFGVREIVNEYREFTF